MEKELLDLTKQEIAGIQPNRCININVGVLGHVDSGKTSICRILSEITSTASLDKNPQSQQRGITLDLGFSAFFTRVPTRMDKQIKQEYLQFTLVDCPGHASLIKTIIGGAQIIDMIFLVIDVTKGIQTQTAQCIIIAQLFTRNIIVVLNKIDLIQDQKVVESKINALRKVFSKTKFGDKVIMVPFSTKNQVEMYNSRLKNVLLDQIELPQRLSESKLLYLIDHCFKIKGKGTILTGTVVEGRVKVGDQIQLCQIQQKCKIKSMQMFRRPIQTARQGDRIAMLMHHLQSDQVERGIACTPGYLRKCRRCIIDVNPIRLYKRPIKTKAKFNIMSGHQTVQGELRLFFSESKKVNLKQSYLALNEITQQMLKKSIEDQQGTNIFAILTLQKDFYCNNGFRVIGYKPDIDFQEKACRIAFSGVIQQLLADQNKQGQALKMFKNKQKQGKVDRLVDSYTIITSEMFDKDTNLQKFIGKQVYIQDCELVGRIEGSFGKSGKIKVGFKQTIDGKIAQGATVTMQYTKWYN